MKLAYLKLCVGFILLCGIGALWVGTKDQAAEPDARRASRDGSSDFQNLEAIFVQIEKDFQAEPRSWPEEDKRSVLERLAGKYEAEAKRGDRASQFKIAAMYLEEVGVQPDYGKALHWFEKAAGPKHPLTLLAEGQFALKCRDEEARSSTFRYSVIQALGLIGAAADKAVPLLKQEIDRETQLSGSAAEALGRIGGSGISILIDALGSNDRGARYGALQGLIAAGEAARPAIPAIRKLLDDEDRMVRGNAKYLLKRLGATEEQQ